MVLDPTHIAATTTAIATVIFSKALEKGGEHIGDAVYQRFNAVVSSVKDKFQQQGSIETLTEAQEHPSEETLQEFTQELMGLMLKDEAFAADLEDSLASFSEDLEVQKIITQEKHKYDAFASQPLSVEQFKENTDSQEQEAKPSLTIKDLDVDED